MTTKTIWTFEGFETTHFTSEEGKVEQDFHRMKVKCKLPTETKIKIINGNYTQSNSSATSGSDGNTSTDKSTAVSKGANKTKVKQETSELLDVSELLDPTGTTDSLLVESSCACGANTVCNCIPG